MLTNLPTVKTLEIYPLVCKTQFRNIKVVFVKIDNSVIQSVSGGGGICHRFENVLFVTFHRCNQKHLYPKLKVCRVNGEMSFEE